MPWLRRREISLGLLYLEIDKERKGNEKNNI